MNLAWVGVDGFELVDAMLICHPCAERERQARRGEAGSR